MRAVTFVAVLALSAQVKRERRTPPPARRSLACARRATRLARTRRMPSGPSSTASSAARQAALPDIHIPMPTRIRGLPGTTPRSEQNITDPKVKVPGTKMIYPGLKDDRRAVILSHFSTSSMLMGRRNRIMRPAYGPPRSQAYGVPIECDLR